MRILELIYTILLVSFGTFAASAGSGSESRHVSDGEETIAVEHAEIVLAPDASDMVAGYLTIWNGTETPAVIEELTSPKLGSIRVHRTEVSDGVARMRLFIGPLTVPPRAELLMKPGGIHLMLAVPKTGLRPGDRVPIALVLSSGSIIAAYAVVRAFGSKPADHHHGGTETSDRH